MAKKMRCGNCGNDVFHTEADNSEFPTILVIECIQCGSRTVYQPEKPRMQQSWGEHSHGIVCIFEKDGE